MDRRLEHVVVAGIAVGLVIVVASSLAMRSVLRREMEAASLGRRSNEAAFAAQRLLTALTDAETGQRGFLLSGDEQYLQPFRSARTDSRLALDALRAAAPDSGADAADVTAAADVLDVKIAELDGTIALRSAGDLAGAMAAVQNGQGKAAMDQVRGLMGKIIRDTQSKRLERTAVIDRARRQAEWINLAGLALLMVFLLGYGLLLVRGLRRRRGIEQALAQREAEKEALLAAERTARSHAERASRVKDEFVATLSHELRTPMNAILGWSQLLRKGQPEGGAVGDGLATIERNARVQAQMIEDLLDISRVTSGKMRLEIQRVDLPRVIHAAIDAVRPAADARGIRLESMLDPRTNLVNGDPTRLQQVVWNLLSNAVKFTSRGGKVQVVLERVNSHVEIRVSDTGKGIKPEFLPHVFERFRQEDASTTRQFGGLGLGLAITKQLVELHGGSVRVTSPGEGRGATFIVDLPLAVMRERPGTAQAHPLTPRAMPIDKVPAELAALKVLVVDDEADSRELIRRVLSDARADVAVAGSVIEALDVFPAFRPDVLLSDIGMPQHDGYELIQRVRRLTPEEGGATPAAALSALARSEDRTRALLAGYQVHVAKPIEPSELVALVASLSVLRAKAAPSRAQADPAHALRQPADIPDTPVMP